MTRYDDNELLKRTLVGRGEIVLLLEEDRGDYGVRTPTHVARWYMRSREGVKVRIDPTTALAVILDDKGHG